MVVLSEELVENLGAPVNSLGLQNTVIWSILSDVVIPTKYSDGRGKEYLAFVVLSDVDGVLGANDVDVEGQLGVLLGEKGENTGQVHNVIHLVVLDDLLVLGVISHIELFVSAVDIWVHFDQISCNDLISTEIVHNGLG